jgi:hypothetical protein
MQPVKQGCWIAERRKVGMFTPDSVKTALEMKGRR